MCRQTSRWRLVALVLPVALVASGCWKSLEQFALETPANPPPDRTGPVVYLTFDDGPHTTYTPQILDILARYNARATFFVLGWRAQYFPELFDRIVSEGHTVANHTWDHDNLAGMSKEEFDRTVGRTEEALGEHATPCLRAPYLAEDEFTRQWAAEFGLKVVRGYESGDWSRPGAEAIADTIVDRIYDGSIIILHDGGGDRSQTVEGLEMALERLDGEGIHFEPLCV